MKNLIPYFLIFIISFGCSSDDGSNNDNDDDDDEVIMMDVDNVVFDESTDGDLSDDSSAPTSIAFSAGDNIVISDQVSGNADYFTFTIPTGYQLAEINLDNYTASDAGFIGIAEGVTLSGNAAEDLLGGLVYNDTNVSTNILPSMGTLSGATGFTGALPSGDYTIWLNQTGGMSTATLNFVLNMQ